MKDFSASFQHTISKVFEIKILNSLDPNVDIDFEGDPLPFPFDMPDDHIRNFLGKYPSVDLKEGIRETYNSFKVLIDRGLIKKNLS